MKFGRLFLRTTALVAALIMFTGVFAAASERVGVTNTAGKAGNTIITAYAAEDGAVAEKSKSGDAADYSKPAGKTMKLKKKSVVSSEEMTAGYNSFSMKALKQVLAQEKEGKNVMISPASLMFALNMAAMGAKGRTYRQMAALLAKGATKKDLDSFSKAYRASLEEGGQINVANSLWINDLCLKNLNISVNEKFLNLLRRDFKAATESLDFDDKAKNEINGWISDKTNGMIKNALDDIDPTALMLIINAIAFEGKWADPYEDYQINENGKFTNYKGEKEDAKMLSSREHMYFTGFEAQGFLKFYEDSKYAFMAILPDDESVSINDFVMNLPDDAFETLYGSRYHAKVDTLTPALTFDYGITLNDTLKKMGMKKAFNKDADFTDIIDPATLSPELLVYISRVIQKTHIELDENGTKASAATIIEFKAEATAAPNHDPIMCVILDRPFAFAIVDTATGTPVFTGVVNSVK
ncbi:MAG: serpin family protein [Lachnospiraceae bacterium]|nr:serpin family protein [Lachnospiraceae bacterium]